MGRRELLIAVAFVACAAIVYHLTAKPPSSGQGFSFSRLFSHVRQSMNDHPPVVATSTKTIPVTDATRELRIGGMSGGVTLTGESRDDIAVVFTARSTGADDAASQACAKGAQLRADTHGDTLTLAAAFQPDCRNTGAVTVSMPRRLAARVEGGGAVRANGIAALKLAGVSGALTLGEIAGAVSGDQRSGAVQIRQVGSLDLTLTSSQSTIETVRATARLDIRNGRCHISGIGGTLDLDERQADVDVTGGGGLARLNGTGGHLRLSSPQGEVRIDGRRTDLALTLEKGVPASLGTTDARIDLRMAAGLAVDLDAIATDGDITAGDWQLTPSRADREARLAHTWGKTFPVSLRTTHGDIAILKIKR